MNGMFFVLCLPRVVNAWLGGVVSLAALAQWAGERDNDK
jgi:hypothetical protein